MGKNNTTCGESTTVRSFVLPDPCLAQQSNRPGGPPGGAGAGPGLPLPRRLGPSHLRGQAPGFWVSERKHREQGGASDTSGGRGVPGTWRCAFCFFPRGSGWPMAGAHLWANPALKMPLGPRGHPQAWSQHRDPVGGRANWEATGPTSSTAYLGAPGHVVHQGRQGTRPDPQTLGEGAPTFPEARACGWTCEVPNTWKVGE